MNGKKQELQKQLFADFPENFRKIYRKTPL